MTRACNIVTILDSPVIYENNGNTVLKKQNRTFIEDKSDVTTVHFIFFKGQRSKVAVKKKFSGLTSRLPIFLKLTIAPPRQSYSPDLLSPENGLLVFFKFEKC